MEKLPPKQVQCACGHTFTTDRRRYWCEKCAKPVFYYPEEQKAYKWHKIYIYGAIAATATLLTYLFLEIIVRPFTS